MDLDQKDRVTKAEYLKLITSFKFANEEQAVAAFQSIDTDEDGMVSLVLYSYLSQTGLYDKMHVDYYLVSLQYICSQHFHHLNHILYDSLYIIYYACTMIVETYILDLMLYRLNLMKL